MSEHNGAHPATAQFAIDHPAPKTLAGARCNPPRDRGVRGRGRLRVPTACRLHLGDQVGASGKTMVYERFGHRMSCVAAPTNFGSAEQSVTSGACGVSHCHRIDRHGQIDGRGC